MERPKRKRFPDFSRVTQFCEDYLDGIEEGKIGEEDFRNLEAELTEKVFSAVYGDSVFDWINQQQAANEEEEYAEEDMSDVPLEYHTNDFSRAINLPNEAGFYWARQSWQEFWNLIVYVEGKQPNFQVTSAWDYTHRKNIYPGFIYEFGPKIEQPKAPVILSKEESF